MSWCASSGRGAPMSQAQPTLRDKDFLAELQAFAEAQRTLIEAECERLRATDAGGARHPRAPAPELTFRFFAAPTSRTTSKALKASFTPGSTTTCPGPVPTGPTGAADQPERAPRRGQEHAGHAAAEHSGCVVTGRKHFMPIVMDSWDQAATMLEAIKTELADNPRLAMDFPPRTGQRPRVEGRRDPHARATASCRPSARARSMRGLRHGPHRPDFVILDDIENDENVRQRRAAQEDRRLGDSRPCSTWARPMAAWTVLYLNTILHYDSVANRFHRKPRWVRRKFAQPSCAGPTAWTCGRSGKNLFLDEAGRRCQTTEAAAVRLADAFYKQHQAEMDKRRHRQLAHRAPAAAADADPGRVAPRLRLRVPERPHQRRDRMVHQHAVLGACRAASGSSTAAHDPSLGKHNKGNDPSACLVGGFDRAHGKLSVVEAKVARRKPEKQIDNIIDVPARVPLPGLGRGSGAVPGVFPHPAHQAER